MKFVKLSYQTNTMESDHFTPIRFIAVKMDGFDKREPQRMTEKSPVHALEPRAG